jgi:tetratricopeptide (TPR) repeat protein
MGTTAMIRIFLTCALLAIAAGTAAAQSPKDCLFTGDQDVRIRACSALIKQEPRNATAYYFRGWAYLEQAAGEDFGSLVADGKKSGRSLYDKAFQDFSKGIEIDPTYLKAYWARATVRSERGESERAIMADYDQAIKIAPGNAEAYYNRGSAYLKSNKEDLALADYTKSIAIDANYADALINRGLIYQRKGDYFRAFQDYDKAIEANPRSALAYAVRGETYAKKGDKERAIADFRKALELEPDHSLAKAGLEELGVKP